MRHKAFLSSITGALQYAISAGFMLVAVSLFVQKLGFGGYGLFSLVSIVGSVNVFANLGLNVSLVRFLAIQGKTGESDNDIVVNLFIVLVVASLFCIIGIMLSPPLLQWVLGVPPTRMNEAKVLFTFLLIANVPLLLGQAATGILDSLMKVYISNILNLLYSGLYWGVVAGTLLLGGSLGVIGMSVLIATAIWCIVSLTVSLLVWGPIKPSFALRPLAASASKQLGYGIQVVTSTSIGILFEPVTKILLSHLGGSQEIAFIDIGFRVKNQIWGFVGKLLYTFYPVVARMTDRGKIRYLINDLEQKTVYFIVPIVSMVVTIALPLATIWIGANTHTVAITIAVISSSHLLFSSTITPYYQYLVAKGFATRTIVLQVINVGVNSLLLIAFYPSIGYPAAVAANAGAILVSCVVTLLYQQSDVGLTAFSPRRTMLQPALVLVATIGIGFSVLYLIGSNIYSIVVIAIVLPISTVLFYRRFRVISWEDIDRYFGVETRVAKIVGCVFTTIPRG